MIKENQVYVTRQPSHITSSILVLTQNFPLSEELHERIGKLCKMSDVMFVFCPNIYHAQQSISLNKFASLYESCAYIKSGSVNQAILKLMEYDREIFSKHLNTLIFTESDLVSDEFNLERLEKTLTDPLLKPIITIDRLRPEEMFEFYKSEAPQKRNWWDLPKLLAWKVVNGCAESTKMMFSSYRSSSKYILLRRATLDIILNFCESEEGEQFIKSFTDPNYKYLFGSLFKYLVIDYLDSDLVK